MLPQKARRPPLRERRSSSEEEKSFTLSISNEYDSRLESLMTMAMKR